MMRLRTGKRKRWPGLRSRPRSTARPPRARARTARRGGGDRRCRDRSRRRPTTPRRRRAPQVGGAVDPDRQAADDGHTAAGEEPPSSRASASPCTDAERVPTIATRPVEDIRRPPPRRAAPPAGRAPRRRSGTRGARPARRACLGDELRREVDASAPAHLRARASRSCLRTSRVGRERSACLAVADRGQRHARIGPPVEHGAQPAPGPCRGGRRAWPPPPPRPPAGPARSRHVLPEDGGERDMALADLGVLEIGERAGDARDPPRRAR